MCVSCLVHYLNAYSYFLRTLTIPIVILFVSVNSCIIWKYTFLRFLLFYWARGCGEGDAHLRLQLFPFTTFNDDFWLVLLVLIPPWGIGTRCSMIQCHASGISDHSQSHKHDVFRRKCEHTLNTITKFTKNWIFSFPKLILTSEDRNLSCCNK